MNRRTFGITKGDFTLGVASDTLMLNKLSPNPFFIYHFFGDACALEKMLSAGIIIDRFGACKHSFQPDTWKNEKIIKIDNQSAGIVSNIPDQAK